jgi:hypothetical protein
MKLNNYLEQKRNIFRRSDHKFTIDIINKMYLSDRKKLFSYYIKIRHFNPTLKIFLD